MTLLAAETKNFFKTTAVFMFFLFADSSHANKTHDGYLVKLRVGASAQLQTHMNEIESLGLKVDGYIPQLNLLKISTADSLLSGYQMGKLSRNAGIEYLEPNYRVSISTAPLGNPEFSTLFNYKIVNAEAGWRITKGSHEVIVGVSDTGIFGHSDLEKNVWTNAGEMGLDANGKNKAKNKVDDDGNGYIDDHRGWNFNANRNNSEDEMYHGTHVSGTIGAVGDNHLGIVGIAWNVRLMSLKFLDREGSGTLVGGISSLIYGADHGAKIINCSWGTTDYSRALKEAIDYLAERNVLVVAAAGNNGSNADKKPMYPAAYDNDNIVSVASIWNKKGQLSYFSNWGAMNVDIAAPGENIYSTFNPFYNLVTRPHQYDYLSGTSMAAPHVSGAAALLLSLSSKFGFAELKSILMDSVYKTPKLVGKISSEGLLDVGAAVKLAVDRINSKNKN